MCFASWVSPIATPRQITPPITKAIGEVTPATEVMNASDVITPIAGAMCVTACISTSGSLSAPAASSVGPALPTSRIPSGPDSWHPGRPFQSFLAGWRRRVPSLT